MKHFEIWEVSLEKAGQPENSEIFKLQRIENSLLTISV